MEKRKASVTWRSAADLNRATRRGVHVDEAGARLRRGVTVADEMGRSNQRDVETVAGLRQARKVYRLGPVAAERAYLCPFIRADRDDAELDIDVNGHVQRYAWPRERPYWEDAWQRIEIPVAALREGDNDVIFRAVGESRWSLLVENSLLPDRSAVSEDGGQTWRWEAMGDSDRADGEYVTRLWLDQYCETGTLESEPVDLMGLFAAAGVAPAGRPTSMAVAAAVTTPQGTGADLEWRAGSSPTYRPESWTAWRSVTDGSAPLPEEARFAQWRLVLSTASPDVTPALTQIELLVEARLDEESAARVVGGENRELARSSYRFAHVSPDEPRCRALRERWNLDEVVAGAASEWEALVRLRQWVRDQWEDGWNMGPLDYVPPWDALVILELAGQQLALGMCTHYATVLTQCCAAMGYTARTQIMQCHCIVEVWSNDHGKWVSMDPGGDSNDETKFTYHFERDGIPQSALELNRAWREGDYADLVVSPTPPPATGDRFDVAKRLPLWQRFMISLRNDELVTLEPGEPEHGKTAYHYDGYLFWADDLTEALPWFSRHTDRVEDLYWSVGQVRIHLQSAGSEAVLVQLETAMPNASQYQVRVDGGEWQEREERFEWALNPGENQLEVRPVNTVGRTGMASRLVVAR